MMTIQKALSHIYIDPLNAFTVGENVKNMLYIKHVLADTDNQDIASNMLAMLTKFNFIDHLYQSKHRHVDAKWVITKLSAYFNESMLYDMLNLHLEALGESKIIQSKQVKTPPQQKPNVISQQQISDQLLITSLDAQAYIVYDQAKQSRLPYDIQHAINTLTQLDHAITTFKSNYHIQPNITHFKKPKSNITYLQGLLNPQYITPPKVNNQYSKTIRIRFLSQQKEPIGVLFILAMINTVLLLLLPGIWQLFAVFMLVLTISGIIYLIKDMTAVKDITLSYAIFIIANTVSFTLMGPSFTEILASWYILLSIFMALTISLISTALIAEQVSSDTSPIWVGLVVGSIVLLILFFTGTWTFFTALMATFIFLASLYMTFYQVYEEFDDYGWWGLILILSNFVVAYANFFPHHIQSLLNLG
jgi:hypothetical protein